MQVNIRKFFAHSFVWLLFIFFEIHLKTIRLQHLPSWQFLLYYVLNICFFYLYIKVYKYSFSKGKPYLIATILQICTIALYSITYVLVGDFALFLKSVKSAFFDEDDFYFGIWRGIYFLGFSTAYFFTNRSISQQKLAHVQEMQLLEAKAEQAITIAELFKSQNDFLKAQINTHLLFNMLSFLYQDMAQKAPGSEEPVMILSEVMHYALLEVREDGKVLLTDELEQVKKYVALNQLFHLEKPQLQLTIETEKGCEQCLILPLLLLPFLENTYKYADLSQPEEPAIISIVCAANILHLHLANRKTDSPYAKSHGIGIDNIKKRLAKHYLPADFSIAIRDTDLHFVLDFKLAL